MRYTKPYKDLPLFKEELKGQHIPCPFCKALRWQVTGSAEVTRGLPLGRHGLVFFYVKCLNCNTSIKIVKTKQMTIADTVCKIPSAFHKLVSERLKS